MKFTREKFHENQLAEIIYSVLIQNEISDRISMDKLKEKAIEIAGELQSME